MKNIFVPTLVLPLLLSFACNGPRKTVAEEAPTGETVATDASVAPQFGGPTAADSLFLSLERTACFGTCKAYRIVVYKSGFAIYDGRANVELLGEHTAHIDAGTMAALLDKATTLGFFDMKDKYDAEVTDLPSTFLRVAANGANKQVIGRVGQPAAFKALVSYYEERFMAQGWKPVHVKP